MNATQKNVKVISTEVSVRQSWREKLVEMKVGSTMLVDLRSALTVRHIISAKIPIYNPDMAFTTKKIKVMQDEKEISVIEVKRIA